MKRIKEGKMQTDEYNEILQIFNEYTDVSYRNKIKEDLKPLMINKYGSLFTRNKCK